MVRAAACFHRHGAATKTVDETLHRTAPHPTPQNNPARRVQTRQAAGVLAQIDPQNHDIHWSAPLPLAKVSDHMRIAARGAGHPIITSDSSDSTTFRKGSKKGTQEILLRTCELRHTCVVGSQI